MDATPTVGRQEQVTHLLHEMTESAGYESALVCTDEGLLVACTGDLPTSEELAGVVSLLEDVVVRSERDLGMARVDEVALLDPGRGRLVIRPILVDGMRFHLVVRVPARATWRRNTNVLSRRLCRVLAGAA